MENLLLYEERRAVAEYGRALVTHRLTRGTGGNISLLNQERGLFALSPSGMDYFKTEPEDIVVMDLEGQVVDGKRRPSSEADMHRLLYRERGAHLPQGDVLAVVHTHSPFATALACTAEALSGEALPPVHYMAGLAGPNLRCIPYAPFGTEKLALLACEGMRGRNAVLLGNHGLLAAGPDLERAFAIAEGIEFACEILCRAREMGTPSPLSREDMRTAMDRFKNYGQRR